MKKLFLILLILNISTVCSATQYYVYVDRVGNVIKGEEAGHSAYGDVVSVVPYTNQYKPTKAELNRYKVFVLELTGIEIQNLLESEMKKIIVDGEIVEEVVQARKRKININKLKKIKQEEVVNDKTIVFKELSVKPAFIVDINE